jgi:hypothetical protein
MPEAASGKSWECSIDRRPIRAPDESVCTCSPGVSRIGLACPDDTSSMSRDYRIQPASVYQTGTELCVRGRNSFSAFERIRHARSIQEQDRTDNAVMANEWNSAV